MKVKEFEAFVEVSSQEDAGKVGRGSPSPRARDLEKLTSELTHGSEIGPNSRPLSRSPGLIPAPNPTHGQPVIGGPTRNQAFFAFPQKTAASVSFLPPGKQGEDGLLSIPKSFPFKAQDELMDMRAEIRRLRRLLDKGTHQDGDRRISEEGLERLRVKFNERVKDFS